MHQSIYLRGQANCRAGKPTDALLLLHVPPVREYPHAIACSPSFMSCAGLAIYEPPSDTDVDFLYDRTKAGERA
jgi:hypothetical protein